MKKMFIRLVKYFVFVRKRAVHYLPYAFKSVFVILT